MGEISSKKEFALSLLQECASVFVHLDPRRKGVVVPVQFRRQPQLVLQVGMNMAVAIPDLDVGEEGIGCTLSFNRRPHFCFMPWSAIYALVGENRRALVWPQDVPPEVVAQEQQARAAERPRPHLRAVPGSPESAAGDGAAKAEQEAEPNAAHPAAASTGDAPQEGLVPEGKDGGPAEAPAPVAAAPAPEASPAASPGAGPSQAGGERQRRAPSSSALRPLPAASSAPRSPAAPESPEPPAPPSPGAPKPPGRPPYLRIVK